MPPMKKSNMFLETLVLTFATFIIAASVFFFQIPSHASIASISGLAIVIATFIPVPISAITAVINGCLLIVAFLLIGKDFGFRTVYTTFLFSLFLALLERLFPSFTSFTGSDVLDVVCYIFFVSIGLAILFNHNASSGGTDIIAKLLNRFFHMDMGHAMSVSGMVLALSSILAFPMRTVLLSVIGTYVNGVVIDHFIFGQNIKRRVCIVSMDHMDEIKNFILHDLHSGASLYDVKGAYTQKIHTEIITIVDKHEYQSLMDFVIKCDPAAFVTVYNVSNMRYLPKK